MKKNYSELGREILDALGGKENISFLTHCVTRLRVNLKDKGLLTDKIEEIAGVIGIQWQGDQLQIIIGQEVELYYEAVRKICGFEVENAINENLDKKQKFDLKNSFSSLLETIASIFAPFIPAIVGCGLMQGLLYSVQSFGLIDAASPEYNFIYTCANTAFYFLPILVAFAAGQRFKCNPYVAAVLGAILIHPNFISLAGEGVQLFGIFPINFADYSSSVIPSILSVYFLSWVERGLKKVVPKMIDIIVTPFVSLFISAIVAFVFIAPLGNFVGSFVAEGLVTIYSSFGLLGGALLGAVYPFILATGMQVAMSPIIVQNLTTLGYDFLYPCVAASNAAMAACAIYLFIRSKNEKVKSLGSSTGVTALIGVTEPVLFGIILKYKKALISTIIGGGIGGMIMGMFTVQYASFGFVPFGTIMLAFGPTFTFYLIGVFVAMAIAVLSMYLLKGEK